MNGGPWPAITLVRKRASLMVLGFGLLLLSELMGLLPFDFAVRGGFALVLQYALLVAALPALLLFRKWPRRQLGELTVSPAAVALDGQKIIAQRAIRRAVTFRDGATSVVRIGSRLRSVDVRFDAAADAEAMLAAIGHSATQTAATFPAQIGGRNRARILVGLALAVTPMSLYMLYILRVLASGRPVHLLSPLVPVAVTVAAMIAVVLSTRRRLVVGADGFTLRSAWGQRFVPYRDLGAVTIEGGDVLLSIRGRRKALRLNCGTGMRRLHGIDASAPALAVVRRIEEARSLVGQGATVDARAFLDRGGRTREEWTKALDRLSDDAASFRTSAVPLDELWKVLEDPSEPPPMRAGAALALRRQLDEPGRARIRVAATTSAAPTLKRVFSAIDEAARTQDDEALEDALDALDADEKKASHR